MVPRSANREMRRRQDTPACQPASAASDPVLMDAWRRAIHWGARDSKPWDM